jgi:hypothetical protein
VGALVAGCGSSSGPSSNSGASNGIANQSASDILTAAINAIKSARSVTLSGTYGSGAQGVQIKSGTFFSSGDVDASLVINGASAHLIKIGTVDYLNADAAFWTAQSMPSADVSKLAGIWVRVPDAATHIGASLALSNIATGLATHAGTVTKGTTSTVNGQAVVSIMSSTNGTLYVATVGTPYPVEATKPGSSGGTLTFSNWNSASAPTAPAGSKSLRELGLPGATGTSGASGASGASGSTGGTPST